MQLQFGELLLVTTNHAENARAFLFQSVNWKCIKQRPRIRLLRFSGLQDVTSKKILCVHSK